MPSRSRATSRIGRFLAACAISDRKSTRLNSSLGSISYAVFCLKKKKKSEHNTKAQITKVAVYSKVLHKQDKKKHTQNTEKASNKMGNASEVPHTRTH